MRFYIAFISLLLVAGICFSQERSGRAKVRVDHKPDQKKVDVSINGKPFTSYYFPGPDLIKKPVLYPVYSPGGNLVTRGWPLNPRAGERVDHPHHIGIWFNYEDVNGNDFWNNSVGVNRPGKKFGTILNTRIIATQSGNEKGQLTSASDWVDHNGKHLLTDTTRITFLLSGKSVYMIDYQVILHADHEDVFFKDVKDGMFAIRLARELELKYNEPQLLTGPDGKQMDSKVSDNTKVTGSYRNKQGLTEDAAWGKPSEWCRISGSVKGEEITVAIADHPQNYGYPGYWHARGYGLFAFNPVARKSYSKEASPLDFKLLKGQSATFRFRVIVASRKLADAEIDRMAADFGSK